MARFSKARCPAFLVAFTALFWGPLKLPRYLFSGGTCRLQAGKGRGFPSRPSSRFATEDDIDELRMAIEDIPFYAWGSDLQKMWWSLDRGVKIRTLDNLDIHRSEIVFSNEIGPELYRRVGWKIGWRNVSISEGCGDINTSVYPYADINRILEGYFGCEITYKLGGSGARFTDSPASDTDLYFSASAIRFDAQHLDRLRMVFEQNHMNASLSARAISIQLDLERRRIDLVPMSSIAKNTEEFPCFFRSNNRTWNDLELDRFYIEAGNCGVRTGCRFLRAFFRGLEERIPNVLLDQWFKRASEPGICDPRVGWTMDLLPLEACRVMARVLGDIASYADARDGPAIGDLLRDIERAEPVERRTRLLRGLECMAEMAQDPVQVNSLVLWADAMVDVWARDDLGSRPSTLASPYALYMHVTVGAAADEARARRASAQWVRIGEDGRAPWVLRFAEQSQNYTKCLHAAKTGDVGTLTSLCNAGINLAFKDEKGHAPLTYAAESGQVEVVRFILRSPYIQQIPDSDIREVLHVAARSGHAGVVLLALESCSNCTDWSALGLASEAGHTGVVDVLINHSTKFPTQTSCLNNALASACKAGHAKIAHRLAQAGAEAGAVHSDGSAALMFAAEQDNFDLFNMLLSRGADPKAQDRRGRSVLIRSATAGHSRIVKEILHMSADPNTQDNEGTDALMHATCGGHVDVVSELIASGADVRAVDRSNCSALRSAAKWGHLDIVEMLLDSRADPNNRDADNGITALMRAVEAGASIGQWSRNPRRPYLDIVKALLQARADVTAKTFGGRTAMMQAKFFQDQAVIAVLRAAQQRID